MSPVFTLACQRLAGLVCLACLPMGPIHAGGFQNPVPRDIEAKMNRLQAHQNYQAGQRHRDPPASGGYTDPGRADGGTGNLTIGDFSQGNNRSLREVNILVDGDIINLNR